ncbi:hypothetical protein IWX65_002875 [Arthrobacter sp. CAN_A214]|uniref:hypothetical protein n=1 Tax=Arthrobacter sp. CAN_A214 TaxID=2787720 RepID=UPI0018CB4B62
MTTHPMNTPRGSPPGSDAAWHVLDEPAVIRFLPSGTPLALRWRGSIWQIIGNPVSWSSSSSWWEPDTTALGGRESLIRTRFWRFQAQTGPASPVLEFDISANPRWQDWRLRRVAGVPGF